MAGRSSCLAISRTAVIMLTPLSLFSGLRSRNFISSFRTSASISLSMLSDEYPLPKSSIRILKPAFLNAFSVSLITEPFSTYALSVISISIYSVEILYFSIMPLSILTTSIEYISALETFIDIGSTVLPSSSHLLIV